MAAALLYIHGFISSPASLKAQQLKRFVEAEQPQLQMQIPALPNTPAESLLLLDRQVQAFLHQPKCQLGLVGSSLGGFFATVLAERYRLPAVLINPAVRPAEFAEHFLGQHTNPYTQQQFTIGNAEVNALAEMQPGDELHSRYWALMQEGDEVLDYRRAADYYRDHQLTIEPGGDHQFQNFDRHLPAVLEFLGLSG